MTDGLHYIGTVLLDLWHDGRYERHQFNIVNFWTIDSLKYLP